MNDIINNKEILTVVQITDTHLFADDHATLYDVYPNQNFLRVIQHIKNDSQLNPDFFLLTGDLSQDESALSYQKVLKGMHDFNVPVYWIPGNHDDLDVMQTVFSQSPLFHNQPQLNLLHWDLIFLNTKRENDGVGFLSIAEQDKLKTILATKKNNEKSIAIIMHHHPIETNTPLIDKYILENRAEFWSLVADNSQIKLIVCGHVHGDYQLHYGRINVECSPATCLQWRKGTEAFIIEQEIGYKVFRFNKKEYAAAAIMLAPLTEKYYR